MSKGYVRSTILVVVFAMSAISCQGMGGKAPATTTAAVTTPDTTPSAPSGPYGLVATLSVASLLVIPLLGFAAFVGRG
jgi:hypothetical protein